MFDMPTNKYKLNLHEKYYSNYAHITIYDM